ncbi:MAG: serine/threonine protein kinase [Nostocaceae cyanobacterium]|nr:serine/threonine protein kinase [Nostocaceae cyanobacterium]
MIGKLLDNRYQIIRVLATGGFGETYIAQDTKRPGNPLCVVKQLKPSTSSDSQVFDTAKRLFNSEAETLERLGNHGQIPRLLAYFVENQEFFLVQEFIEGHPLSEELLPGQTWSESQVIYLLQEVLSILAFVHSQNVIHRDIKPDNIIRRARDNKLVLVDFGAVKQLRSPYLAPGGPPTATVAIGTPGYMPTEQGQGKPRANSDLYALGIIAIQALTGVQPMELQEDPNTGEIIWQHLASVSERLAGILTKMVHYHFKDRYHNASQALEALQLLSPCSTPPEIPKINNYQTLTPLSLDSRQKTLAVAPGNPIPAKPPAPTNIKATSPSSNSHRPDFLQLLILVVLAGGAAAIAPAVVSNVQNFANNFTSSNDAFAKKCLAVVAGNSNVRSEPSAIYPENILETVTNDTKFKVTGRRTKLRWVELKLDSGRVGWAHSDVIKNNEEWVSCLRDKGIAIKIVDDRNLIADRPVPKPKSPDKPSPTTPTETGSAESNSSTSQTSTSSEPASKILEKARKKYESGDLLGALKLLNSIPKNASDFKEIKQMKSQWEKDWAKSEALFNDINKAMDDGQWDRVLDYQKNPEKLPDIEYWRKKIKPLFEKAQENQAKQQSENKSKADNNSSSSNLLEKLLSPDTKEKPKN